MSMPSVTIIVPMRNEEAFIEACLVSLCTQEYPHELLEILVVDGESTDRSSLLVTDLAAREPRLHLIHNPRRTQAAAMNLGIANAQGEIIVRADAHAVYGPTYVATCVEHLRAGRADNVGGLQRGQGTTPFSRAVAAAQNSLLGAGNAPYRLATDPCYADTVWLGAWYRKTLVELGGFNEEMLANEDYELNCRLRERGGRILLDPTLSSTYFPRTAPLRLWRQYFRYGQSKVRTVQLHPTSLLLRQLAAPCLVGALFLAALLLPVTPLPIICFGVPYVLTLLGGSVYAGKTAGMTLFPHLLLCYATMHVAWGLGFWYGILTYGGFPFSVRKLIAAERALRSGADELPR